MLLRNWMPFLFVIFHKDIHWCWSFIHFLRPFQCGNLYPSVLRCFLEFMFGIFSCLSLELLLLRHWTLWIHAVIFLPFFPLFCIFRFIIFYVNMFDLSYPIECYKYLLLYFNFLFIFSWIHEYKILSLSFWDFFFFNLKDNCFTEFCFLQVSAWMDHRYTYVPSLLTSLPSPSSPHPSRLLLSEIRNCDISFLILLLFCALVWFVFLLLCMSSAFLSFKFIFFC